MALSAGEVKNAEQRVAEFKTEFSKLEAELTLLQEGLAEIGPAISAPGTNTAFQETRGLADRAASVSAVSRRKEPGLLSNYPNPFNPETNIEYKLNETAQVSLVIHNIKGQIIRTLVDKVQSSGNYHVSWDGRDEGGLPVATGVYLYRLQAGDKETTRTLLLVK